MNDKIQCLSISEVESKSNGSICFYFSENKGKSYLVAKYGSSKYISEFMKENEDKLLTCEDYLNLSQVGIKFIEKIIKEYC